MVADAITGNISPEATTQTGNIFADATRGAARSPHHGSPMQRPAFSSLWRAFVIKVHIGHRGPI